jgi:hypothetical protein
MYARKESTMNYFNDLETSAVVQPHSLSMHTALRTAILLVLLAAPGRAQLRASNEPPTAPKKSDVKSETQASGHSTSTFRTKNRSTSANASQRPACLNSRRSVTGRPTGNDSGTCALLADRL